MLLQSSDILNLNAKYFTQRGRANTIFSFYINLQTKFKEYLQI